MINDNDLPEGVAVLHREPPEPSVELALDLARLGGSLKLVRAAGGEEAVEAVEAWDGEQANGHGNGSTHEDGS
jgi:hypothetical protein